MSFTAKQKLTAWLAANLIRALALTLRIRIEDRCGVRDPKNKQPVIWAFWHNRMLLIPAIRNRYLRHRSGSVLTSPSGDGAILAAVMEQFGIGNVRGSSSRRGSAATLELTSIIKRGGDVAITPDGPRGPRYKLGAGIIFLAQKTGAPVMPIHVEYSRCVRLKSWDQFRIPLPFSRVNVTLDALFHAVPECDAETERARLETSMQPQTP